MTTARAVLRSVFMGSGFAPSARPGMTAVNQSSSISPSICSKSSMPPTCSRIVAGSFWLGLSAPRAAASRTAFSISRCEVMPTFLRNFRTLAFNASSFMIVSPLAPCLQNGKVAGPCPSRHALRNFAHGCGTGSGLCGQPLDQHVGARRAKRGELRRFPDILRHHGAIAFGVAEPIEEARGRLGQEPHRAAAVEHRLVLELRDNGGADAAAAQRRQDQERTQQGVLAVDLQAAETDRNGIRGLEA